MRSTAINSTSVRTLFGGLRFVKKRTAFFPCPPYLTMGFSKSGIDWISNRSSNQSYILLIIEIPSSSKHHNWFYRLISINADVRDSSTCYFNLIEVDFKQASRCATKSANIGCFGTATSFTSPTTPFPPGAPWF